MNPALGPRNRKGSGTWMEALKAKAFPEAGCKANPAERPALKTHGSCPALTLFTLGHPRPVPAPQPLHWLRPLLFLHPQASVIPSSLSSDITSSFRPPLTSLIQFHPQIPLPAPTTTQHPGLLLILFLYFPTRTVNCLFLSLPCFHTQDTAGTQ